MVIQDFVGTRKDGRLVKDLRSVQGQLEVIRSHTEHQHLTLLRYLVDMALLEAGNVLEHERTRSNADNIEE